MLEGFEICNDLDICLSWLQHNAKLAVAVSHEHARNNRLIPYSQMYCFENSEAIYEYALKFLVRDKFPFLLELNQFIRLADAGGLIRKWNSNRSTLIEFQHNEKYYNQITIEHFFGFFFLLSGILLFAFSIFILEIIVHKNVNKPNSKKFWRNIQMIIDSKRYFCCENKFD